jgi:hypothetical protein
VSSRFLDAATKALGEPLTRHAFVCTASSDDARGGYVEFTNECIVISVSFDRLEGELSPRLRPIGGRDRDLETVLDTKAVKALSLRRLPRDATQAALERRLGQLYALLATQHPGLLNCDAAALEALG